MASAFSSAVQRSGNVCHRSLFRDALHRVTPTTVSTLPNGVRVACETVQRSGLCTVGLWIESGSNYDDPYFAGTSRLFHQCGFLGTAKQSQSDIVCAVRELGSQVHFNVGRELTYIFMHVHKASVEKAVGFLADVALNARLSNADITAVRKMVELDMKCIEEQPEKKAFDLLFHAAYSNKISGFATPQLGAQSFLQRVTYEQLAEYKSKVLTGNRMALVGSGDVDHAALEKFAERYLCHVKKDSLPCVSHSVYTGGESRLRGSTSCLCWGFEICGAVCSDVIPLSIASALIKGTTVAAPFPVSQEFPEDRYASVLCQDTNCIIQPFLFTYKDSGLCGATIVPKKNGSGNAGVCAIAQELQKNVSQWHSLGRRGVDDQLLQYAKTKVKQELLEIMDSGSNSVLDIGKQVLQIGRRVPLCEMFDRIDDVSSSVLQKVIDNYFIGCLPVYSYLGDTESFLPYSKAKRWTKKYWR